MASGKEASKEEIPLQEMQHFRGVAQEQSFNTFLSAQRRFENAKADDDSTRDCVYDAIADAKKQISEKDKIPFGGEVKDEQEENTQGYPKSEKQEESEDCASKGIFSSIGETLSDYAKNVKGAIVGTDAANSDNPK